jgi:hypothetical protein
MSKDEIRHEIARCDREIATMEAQEPVAPAYLTTLGIMDWHWERRLLEGLLESAESYEASEALLSARV